MVGIDDNGIDILNLLKVEREYLIRALAKGGRNLRLRLRRANFSM